jgi:aerobic-type carbon monoxide dehydrogenase small subunit (CoxS/CutS family)
MADEEKVPAGEPEQAPMKISRRDFLVGVGAGVVVTGAAAAGYIALQQPKTVEVVKEVPVEVIKEVPAGVAAPSKERPTGPRLIQLNVNGLPYNMVAEPRLTLGEALRRDLGLTGTKIGCNRGQCAACTVLVDGKAMNSCMLLAVRQQGKKIITTEGLMMIGHAFNGASHPIHQAFVENQGQQCTICIPGQVMSAADLLNKTFTPTETQVKEALAGNICRCSAYPNIVKSVVGAGELLRKAGYAPGWAG